MFHRREAEHLAVADVVAQETDLSEHDGEVGGYEQLVPGVAEQEQGRPAGPVEAGHQGHPDHRPPGGVLEQAGGADLAGQVEVTVLPAHGAEGGANEVGAVTGTPSTAAGEQGGESQVR